MIKRKDAQASVDRWPGWTPSLAIFRVGRFYKRGIWYGPQSGRHVCYAFTSAGLHRSMERELASWTRKIRRKEQHYWST